MLVGEMMTAAPYVCRPDDSLQHAAELMAQHECGCLPIVDGDTRVVGVLTDRDVCVAAGQKRQSLERLRVGEHMATHVYRCTPDVTLERACELMRNHRVRRLVVAEESGRLLGLLSLDDLAHARTRGALDARHIVEALASASVSRVYG